MALQDSEVPSSILNATAGNRPTASYHPTLWGEKFLDHSSVDDSVVINNVHIRVLSWRVFS